MQDAVTKDHRLRDVELQNRGDRAARAQFGRESDPRVDRQHHRDRSRLDDVAEEERDHERRDEEEHHDAAKLLEKNPERRDGRGRRKTIGPVPRQLTRGLFGGESPGRRVMRGECSTCTLSMPARRVHAMMMSQRVAPASSHGRGRRSLI